MTQKTKIAPLAQIVAAAAGKTDATAAASAPARQPYLLFADDNPVTLRLYEEAARFRNWRADFAQCPSDILAKVSDLCRTDSIGEIYDAVILDINYADQNQPGRCAEARQSGISVALEIRKCLPQIPLVFVTSYTNNLIGDEIKKLGGAMIHKPVPLDKLLNKIASIVEQAHGIHRDDPLFNRINREAYVRQMIENKITVEDKSAHGETAARQEHE